MDRPADTVIDVRKADIDVTSKNSTAKERQAVRIYKYSPDAVLLQIWGKRANTPMHANAVLDKEQLTALRDAATALLAFL